ncbi:MAG TPA: class I SAM-dependent methyltransferase [Pseudonocardia sp.]|uniref:class I SAM-dependent methyltransferase n=1 Tax=Pseudonocardia sp. TaxID=60912 RepID=UPI002F41B842
MPTSEQPERGLANLDLLTTPAGQAVLAELADTEMAAAAELRVAEALRRRYPAELVTAALAQHELRRRARAKFSLAGEMWFTRAGLEQASSEAVARHRARRYAGAARVVDLCCGIGGDLVALAGAATAALAVDRDPLHLRMAALNAAVHGLEPETLPADVRDAPLQPADAVFVDPARRSGGRRLRAGDSEPPLDWCTALAERVAGVAVKAAPGLDRGSVPPGWEVEFVAEGRDLKEAVLWSPALRGAPTRATLLPAGDQLLANPGGPVDCRAPGEYLLDPNPAVTRAGLVEDLARRLGAWKIDPMIAFLSADIPLRTPFGRTLRVLEHGPWREKDLAARLRAHGIGALDIRRRGLAGDVDVLRRKLRTTGRTPATLVMTRVDDRPWALICVED